MPVHHIVRVLANGVTVEDLLSEYPFLSHEDIMACLDYAAALAEEQITRQPNVRRSIRNVIERFAEAECRICSSWFGTQS